MRIEIDRVAPEFCVPQITTLLASRCAKEEMDHPALATRAAMSPTCVSELSFTALPLSAYKSAECFMLHVCRGCRQGALEQVVLHMSCRRRASDRAIEKAQCTVLELD